MGKSSQMVIVFSVNLEVSLDDKLYSKIRYIQDLLVVHLYYY